jgi:SDR family mycofactocin-dependent oxidoreductase
VGRVQGKVVFITGAARGQGRSHAAALAREGADIVAFDICGEAGNVHAPPSTPEDLAETVRLVEQADRRVMARQGDVRDLPRLKEVADEAAAEFGRIDVVIGNAAISNFAPAWEISSEDWQNHIDINLTGNFNLMKAFAPAMMDAGEGGSFIFVGSGASTRGNPLNIHYVAAKHGLVGFSHALAVELAPYRIRVNNVFPGLIDTPLGRSNAEALMQMLDGDFKHHQKWYQPVFPTEDGIFMDSIDISNAIVYLASDESRYVTGLDMNVDAGFLL